MAQWESARLEAEARLVRESKLRSHSFHSSSSTSAPFMNKTAAYTAATPTTIGHGGDLESPTSTLSFSETNNNNNNNNVAAAAPVMSGTAITNWDWSEFDQYDRVRWLFGIVSSSSSEWRNH
ncbi:hypothetical protein Pint_19189 [Pistacia integerrima]|uniref:Uncharacterized protein n=1 Tax=Pistacia integerrima TaxID=434235 RepID=A0ACC0YUM8_9ROSI|nr:hypothetical protein Pint_19189 [Pistacia integerrima]